HRQHLYFRPDWEKVVTPVVDWVLERPEVDPARIVLHGISQAGYWVPRAVAFEPRIAAAVADPGVVRVADSWRAHLPEVMTQLLDQGDKKDFDAFLLRRVRRRRPATARPGHARSHHLSAADHRT
ncbi:MAG: acetylxylan esterase, partial [Acidimicrobiia bacterium]|nr:acetylxylan esterase [Acidimicrobiia bacterium]